jgi:hypothetical protein
MYVRRVPRGRYACGCRTALVHGSHGVTRLAPFCRWHGEGPALTTVVMRRLSAFLDRALHLF